MCHTLQATALPANVGPNVSHCRPQRYQPTFAYHGFQYVQITGLNLSAFTRRSSQGRGGSDTRRSSRDGRSDEAELLRPGLLPRLPSPPEELAKGRFPLYIQTLTPETNLPRAYCVAVDQPRPAVVITLRAPPA